MGEKMSMKILTLMEFCSHLNGILFSPQWNFVLTSMEFRSHLNGISFSPQSLKARINTAFFDICNQVGNQERNQVGNQVFLSIDNAAYDR